jgi:hypothetical protein
MTFGDSSWRRRAKPLLGTLVEVALRSVDDAPLLARYGAQAFSIDGRGRIDRVAA